MTISDGRISRYVASHFAIAPADVDEVVSSRGTSLRYGRVGLPALLWLFSLGQPAAMRFVQPLLMVLSGAAVAAATRSLFGRAGWIVALLPFLALGVTVSVGGGFAEAPAVAFGSWAVAAANRERWGWSAFALSLALLTRENAGAIFLGIVVACALWRKPRVLLTMTASLAPIVIWYAYVASKYGHIPILDPYLRVKTSTIGLPFVAIFGSVTHKPVASAITAAVHLALALVGLRIWKRGLLGAVAAASALQIFSAGRFSFHFIGEAVRAGAFLQLFIVLSVAQMRFKQSDTLAA